MSRRHRTTASTERVPKRDRRWSTHQERQAVRGALRSAVDPEDLMTPKPVAHHGPRNHQSPAPHRPRHWKLKVWKRRSTMRRQRAEAMARSAEEAMAGADGPA